MVRHILLWQLKDELTPAEKRAEAEQCKRDLEALVGVVPGLCSRSRWRSTRWTAAMWI